MTATPDDLTGYDEEADYSIDPPEISPVETDAFSLANWHIREVARIRARRAELKEHFEAEMRRLRIRLDDRLSVLDGEERWHTIPVTNLHRAILSADADRKTITLAGGTMTAKARQPEWKYVPLVSDDRGETPENFEAFLAWAEQNHPELIAPRTVGVKLPATAVPALMERLLTIDDIPGIDIAVTPPVPDKNAVKRALVKKDEKGKSVLVRGVDPETMEKVPGLVVLDREPEYSIDTDDAADEPPSD